MRSGNRFRWSGLLAMPMLIGTLACRGESPTSADSALISVRLRADAGESAGRNPVIVTRVGGNADTRQASIDGSGEIAVASAGTYLVRVVPRAGFVSSDQLRLSLSVSDGERVRINFTLYRDGQPTEYLPPMVERGY